MTLLNRLAQTANSHYQRNSNTAIATMMRIANYSKHHNVSLDEAVDGYHYYASVTTNRMALLLKAQGIIVVITAIIAIADTFVL